MAASFLDYYGSFLGSKNASTLGTVSKSVADPEPDPVGPPKLLVLAGSRSEKLFGIRI
jgi:hypothetical protein